MKFFLLVCVTLYLSFSPSSAEEDQEWVATTAKFSSKEMLEKVFDIVSPSCKEEMTSNMESAGEYTSSCKAQIKGAVRIIEAPKAEKRGPEKPSARRQPPHPDEAKEEQPKKSKKSKNNKQKSEGEKPNFGIHPMVTTVTYAIFFGGLIYLYLNFGKGEAASEEPVEVARAPTRKVKKQHIMY